MCVIRDVLFSQHLIYILPLSLHYMIFMPPTFLQNCFHKYFHNEMYIGNSNMFWTNIRFAWNVITNDKNGNIASPVRTIFDIRRATVPAVRQKIHAKNRYIFVVFHWLFRCQFLFEINFLGWVFSDFCQHLIKPIY